MGLKELRAKQRQERVFLEFDAMAAAYFAVMRAFRREKNTIKITEAEWIVEVLAGALALAEAESGAKRERLRELRAGGEENGVSLSAAGIVHEVRPCFVCGACVRLPRVVAGYICSECKEDFREVMAGTLADLGVDLDATPDDGGDPGR